MQFKDYYKIMGVAPDATADQIKAAYRTLARKLHPDVNKAKDAQKRFTDLGEAYEALSDPSKRTSYDELRSQGWKEGQDFQAPPAGARRWRQPEGASYGPVGGEFSADQFSDFFSSLFGARGGARAARETFEERGEDIHHPIELTLLEAYAGGERELKLRLPPSPGGKAVTRTLHVTIPKGMKEGEHIRLRGQGMPGASAELAGNLYLEVAIAPHPFFRLDGRNILLDLPVAPWEAVLGAQVDTPTLGGVAKLTIPANSQEGQTLRMRGRGWPGEPPGDQLVRLYIAVPSDANDKAKALWRDLATESGNFKPRRKLGL